MASNQSVTIIALNSSFSGELLDDMFHYGDRIFYLVKYSVSIEDYLSLFDPETLNEYNAGFKAPMFSVFAEPLQLSFEDDSE